MGAGGPTSPGGNGLFRASLRFDVDDVGVP